MEYINGRYDLDSGVFMNSVLTLTLLDCPNKVWAGKTITLFRCTMKSKQKWWFLSEVDKEKPGSSNAIDYYPLKSKATKMPENNGWLTFRIGVKPAPALEATVDEGCGIIVIAQWGKWGIANEVFDIGFQNLDTTISSQQYSNQGNL